MLSQSGVKSISRERRIFSFERAVNCPIIDLNSFSFSLASRRANFADSLSSLLEPPSPPPPDEPPFRPRFMDRALAQAEHQGITPVIVCNKWDLAEAMQTDGREEEYEEIENYLSNDLGFELSTIHYMVTESELGIIEI